MPGNASRCERNSAAGVSGPRRSSPFATASATRMIVATRFEGPRSTSRPRSAMTAAGGNKPPSPSSATRRPITVRAAATEICWPISVRNRASSPSAAPGIRMPGTVVTSGASTGSADSAASIATESASRSNIRRTRADSAGVSARLVSRAVMITPARSESSRTVRSARPPGSARARRKCSSSPDSSPGTAWSAKKRNRPRPSNGERAGSRRVSGVAASAARTAVVPAPPRPRARALASARSSVGVLRYTSAIVSLNCRRLPNPAAKAMSLTGSSVAASRERAVCARFARARASGPAPSSVRSTRVTCRGVYPRRRARPSTPSRSMTPSCTSRIAREARSSWRFQSGEPGTASGWHRLQARSPASCAAAAVR